MNIGVDSQLAGAVIGDGGANIQRIQSVSGARLHFDSLTDTKVRRLAITGNLMQVSRAFDMVSGVLENASKEGYGGRKSRV